MRHSIFILLALLLTFACQWNRTGDSARTPMLKVKTHNDGIGSQLAATIPAHTVAPVSAGFSEAQFALHVEQIKKRLPSPEFSIVIQSPFVVIGDEPEKTVKQRADDTVKWAVDRLKQSFFTKDPKEILDIWLFKDDASYEKHTRLLLVSRPPRLTVITPAVTKH